MVQKHLQVRFDKRDGFIRIYDGTRSLTSFGSENYAIYNTIRYLISVKVVSLRLTLHVIILIKPVLNKDKYHYCYNIFLEKCSYQLAKK